jgi:hypothetical protein
MAIHPSALQLTQISKGKTARILDEGKWPVSRSGSIVPGRTLPGWNWIGDWVRLQGFSMRWARGK